MTLDNQIFKKFIEQYRSSYTDDEIVDGIAQLLSMTFLIAALYVLLSA